jgi:hypothetical protein
MMPPALTIWRPVRQVRDLIRVVRITASTTTQINASSATIFFAERVELLAPSDGDIGPCSSRSDNARLEPMPRLVVDKSWGPASHVGIISLFFSRFESYTGGLVGVRTPVELTLLNRPRGGLRLSFDVFPW